MPDLGHVSDLVTLELHDIDVIRTRALAGRWNRATGTSMCPMENSVRDDVVPHGIRGE